jgi:general secretion pathway protein D
MGIDWSKFQLGFFADSLSGIFGINSDSSSSRLRSSDVDKVVKFDASVTFSIDGVFDFLKDKGRTSVVSSPKILTLNNQQALITVGDTINYQTLESTTDTGGSGNTLSQTVNNYSLFVGILLNILPTVSDDNKIMLRINPSLSDFKYSEDNQKQSEPRRIAPDTTEKKLSTVVNVKSGDTIVLGGLITNSVSYTNRGVPVLSSIPLLGYAFKYAGDATTTKELVFVITPRVIGEDMSSVSLDSLSDLGYSHIK